MPPSLRPRQRFGVAAVVRALERRDPGWIQAERAARVTVIVAAATGALYALASREGLPREGVWLGLTVAQYLAWFVVGSAPGQLLRLCACGLGCAAAGLAVGTWAPAPGIVMATVVASCAGAFALQGVSGGARTAALAGPYTLVFAAYYALPPGHSA